MIKRALTGLWLAWLVASPVLAQNGQAKQAARPCEQNPAYRQLDFWVGRWDVFLPDGRKAGTNLIEKTLGGCALIENWTDTFGHEGKSLFYYHAVKGQWKQVWVTDSGPLKEKALVETVKDGGVRFQGEVLLPSGSTVLDRTTLTPLGPDRVRQVIEQSRDGGKTWQVTFDGAYVRQK